MNWNPFKRIADLERNVRTQAAQIADLNRKSSDLNILFSEQTNWITSLQNQLIHRPVSQPVTITRADVEKETKARLKRAAYSRKYYANKRAEAAKAAAAAAGDAK